MCIRDRDIPFIGYNYIIVDEIHDILDKGVIEVLDHLASMTNCGLSTGRYLVLDVYKRQVVLP